MKVKLYTSQGEKSDERSLPEKFDSTYRPDLIRRAFLSSQANQKQPYGTDPDAGLDTSAESPGAGRGIAQVPRIRNSDRAARVPHAVGGRKAHPPKVEKERGEKINKKEKKKAFESAVSATTDKDLVVERGHIFDAELPIVLESDFEQIQKTKNVVSVLEKLEIYEDIKRADEGRNIRSGKGKMRGRKYREPKSILFVTSEEFKAARNLPGADVVEAENLSVGDLAPGGVAGRLTVWTEPSLEIIKER